MSESENGVAVQEPPEVVDESAAEPMPSLDSLLARMRQVKADAKEEPTGKPEAKSEKGPEPQEKSPPVAAPSQEGPSLPSWLISRAADYGLTQDEAKAWGSEESLSRHLEGLDRMARTVAQRLQPKEEQKKEPAPESEEDIWEGMNFDEDTKEIINRLEKKLAKKYGAKIASLEEDLKFVGGHVQAQAMERNRSAFDKMLDGLEGYEDSLGKGAVESGTSHWENRAKLEAAMNFELEFYEKLGKKLDRPEAMKSAASKLFKQQTEESPKRPVPPKDPATGKFTPTNRPTSRAESELPHGRDRAAKFVTRYQAEHNLGDED